MAEERDWLDYLDVFGSLLMGVITFLLGFVLSEIINKRKNKEELRLQRSYFDLYWGQQLAAMDEQIKIMNEFTDRLASHSSFRNINATHQLQPFFIYDAMDKQKLVESFRVKNEEITILNRMLFIELIRSTFEKFIQFHKIFQESNISFGSEWNETMKEFHSLKMELFNQPKLLLSKNPSVKEVQNCTAIMSKLTEVGEIATKAIQPLEEYFVKVYNQDPSNEYARLFLPVLSKLRRIDTSHKQGLQSLSKAIKEQVEILREKSAMHIKS